MADRRAWRAMRGWSVGAAALLVAALAALPGQASSQVIPQGSSSGRPAGLRPSARPPERQQPVVSQGQSAGGPVGVNPGERPGDRTASAPIELQGDEPLAQYLILRFMKGHPDLSWRIRGREFYAQGDYVRARECFERAARFSDKPSQAMLAEMHWEGLGGERDRALGYAWMDLAAERYYEDFYLLREHYWSQLGPQEREQALRRGQPLLRQYGDEKAKRRLARVMVRERPDELAVGGFFGNLPIIPPSGAGRDSITLRGSEYFDDTFWEPDAYFAWQDTIWKTLLTTGRVEVGDPARAAPAAAD